MGPDQIVKKNLMPTNAANSLPTSSVDVGVGTDGWNIGAGLNKGVDSIYAGISQSGFGAEIRKFGSLLPKGGEPGPEADSNASATWGSNSDNSLDWRVKLSLAPGYDNLQTEPLVDSDNAMVFPLTPTIMINHTASYTPIKPIHSNYPFYAYQNSALENITITGEFPVENEHDGAYWVAANHYLRSVSKMAYGDTPNVGSPPPVIKLNGYGDYVFKDVPVVVSNFNVELANDIDYILVKSYKGYSAFGGTNGTYVPAKSTISVTLIPMYSRRQVRKFSLEGFVQGYYLSGNMKGMR